MIVRAFDAERCENAHLSGLPVPFYDVEDGILADQVTFELSDPSHGECGHVAGNGTICISYLTWATEYWEAPCIAVSRH